MDNEQEWEETIDTFLTLILGKEDAKKFGDFDRVLGFVRQGSKYWQAPTVIGVRASVLFSYTLEEGENSRLRHIIDYAVEPLESFLEHITPHAGQAIDDESGRLLFHTRFGLGLLLLIKSRLKEDLDIEEKAVSILHEMASTQLSWKDLTFREGPGIVKYFPDLGHAKVFAALYMPMVYPYQDSANFNEVLFHMCEALPYAGYWHTTLIQESCQLLEKWASKCEEDDNTREYNFPSLEWLDLFAIAVDILSSCEDIDSSGTLPNECRKESAQYLAWEFGYLVGQLITPGNRWKDGPFEHFWELSDAIDDESIQFDRGREQVRSALKQVLALLTEHSKMRDFGAAHKQYVTLWRWSDSYRGMPLAEIGPQTDLFWAMKIGLLDKLSVVSPVPYSADSPETVRDTDAMKNILSTIALRQLKNEVQLERIVKSLPEDKKEVYLRLEQRLHAIWKELPGKVANALAKAEKYFETEVNDDDAKVWFYKAVEASLHHCFVVPLCESVRKRDAGRMTLRFSSPRGQQPTSAARIQKLSLGEWSDIFTNLDNSSGKGLDSLGTKELVAFIKSHLRVSGLPDLAPVAAQLSRCQEYRSGSAHYQEATPRYEKERWELEQLRDTVLGIGQPSVVVEIFRRLAAPTSPKRE